MRRSCFCARWFASSPPCLAVMQGLGQWGRQSVRVVVCCCFVACWMFWWQFRYVFAFLANVYGESGHRGFLSRWWLKAST